MCQLKSKLQSHKYWIMVRGVVAGVCVEGDFLWCIEGLMALVRALVGSPVTVGENTVSLDIDGW